MLWLVTLTCLCGLALMAYGLFVDWPAYRQAHGCELTGRAYMWNMPTGLGSSMPVPRRQWRCADGELIWR